MWSSASCGSRGSPVRYGCWRPAVREILAAPPDGEPEEAMDEMTVGIAALERTPLFAGLDREDLQKVLGCGQRVSLERGGFFGEMAVLASERREATVKAVEPVEALRIPADGLQAFLLENPKVAVGMLKSLVE